MTQRIAAATTALLALAGLQFTLPDAFPAFVAALLVGAVVVQWAAAVFFNRESAKDPSIISLRARAQDAVSLALASTVAAFLGVLVIARQVNALPAIDRAVFLVGLAFALVMTAAPAVNWLITWRPWRSS